jgi:hypothetical protein
MGVLAVGWPLSAFQSCKGPRRTQGRYERQSAAWPFNALQRTDRIILRLRYAANVADDGDSIEALTCIKRPETLFQFRI